MYNVDPNKLTVDLEFEDHTIQGKVLVANLRMHDMEFNQLTGDQKDYIRNMLCTELASYMLKNKLVEINSMKTPMFETIINARCCVVPDTSVKILRTVRRGK